MQKDLDNLNKWCHDNKLVLNGSKTKLIHIRSPYAKARTSRTDRLIIHNHSCLHFSTLTCNCPCIESLTKHTYLGLIIDNKFNWLPHITHVCDKLRAFLANMYVIGNRIPFRIKLLLYNALAESIIGYGLTSYGRTFKSFLKCVYNLQIRILKTIVPSSIKAKYSNDEVGLFRYCNVLPIHTKITYSLLKENFFNLDVQRHIIHDINTRQKANKKLVTTTAKNAYGERTLQYLIPHLINNLQQSLIQSITKTNIKCKLKSHFLNNL